MTTNKGKKENGGGNGGSGEKWSEIKRKAAIVVIEGEGNDQSMRENYPLNCPYSRRFPKANACRNPKYCDWEMKRKEKEIMREGIRRAYAEKHHHKTYDDKLSGGKGMAETV